MSSLMPQGEKGNKVMVGQQAQQQEDEGIVDMAKVKVLQNRIRDPGSEIFVPESRI
jgi:hypothetical protein